MIIMHSTSTQPIASVTQLKTLVNICQKGWLERLLLYKNPNSRRPKISYFYQLYLTYLARCRRDQTFRCTRRGRWPLTCVSGSGLPVRQPSCLCRQHRGTRWAGSSSWRCFHWPLSTSGWRPAIGWAPGRGGACWVGGRSARYTPWGSLAPLGRAQWVLGRRRWTTRG